MSSVALTVTTLLLWFSVAARGTENVTVFRCCGRGYTLDAADVNGECAPLPASEPQDFVPVIYDMHSSQFLAPNTTPPPYWNMVRARPPCAPAAAFLSASPLGSPSGIVPFLNGSLWVQNWPVMFVDPGQYCLDRGGALVCRPDEPNKTRKCCGPSAGYSELNTSCQVSGPHDPADLPADVVAGFPRCDDDLFVMSGRVNESHWPVDDQWPAGGALRTADGAVLQPREYCLEHVLEDREPRAWTVFTCAARHDPDRVTKSYRDDIRFTLYPLGLLLSAFFLAVTLVASCMLPSTYHVLHWKCQVNHVGCLLVGDLFLAFVQLSGDSLRGPLCIFTGMYPKPNAESPFFFSFYNGTGNTPRWTRMPEVNVLRTSESPAHLLANKTYVG